MALTIEDGSIISGANSYITRANYITWAAERGTTVTDDSAADAKLVQAWDYINSLEPQLLGRLVSRSQVGAYPRYDLIDIQGWSWDSDEIPQQVIDLQCSLALDQENSIDIWNPSSSASTPVKRNRVEGAVEQEFAVADQMGITYKSLTNGLIAILSKPQAHGFSIPVSRG